LLKTSEKKWGKKIQGRIKDAKESAVETNAEVIGRSRKKRYGPKDAILEIDAEVLRNRRGEGYPGRIIGAWGQKKN